MARYAIKTLEFDKVKNILADKTATALGRQAVGAMRIESEFSKVKRLQEETAEALRIMDEVKRFPLFRKNCSTFKLLWLLFVK